MNTTDGRIYLLALTTLTRVEIQFIPQNVKLTSKADVPEVAIVGRNTPQYQSTGGRRSLKMKLDFHANHEDRADVLFNINQLESLRYSDGPGHGQEKLKLIWGDLFDDTDEWILESIDVDYSMFDGEFGLLPRQAFADITLLYDPPKNLTYTLLRNR